MVLVERYLKLPKPSKADHLWRYTPWLKMHPLGDFSKIPENVATPKIKLSYLDGSVPKNVSLEFSNFESKVKDLEPDVSAAFIRAICANSCIKLDIRKDTILEQPLFLEIIANNSISALNLVIDNNSKNKIELITSVRGDAEWFGLLREGNFGKGSNCAEMILNQLSSKSKFLRADNIVLKNDAKFDSATLSLGGLRCKSDIRARIQGPGVDYNQKVAIHGKENRNDDIHLRIFHESRNSNSRVVAHTICDDSSKNTITGKLIVNKDAQNTDAGQKFLNLLLSKDSKVNSIPELEVLANEVLAAHGASSAPINSEQLFYLRSRGLNLDEAKAMIVDGFLMSTFENFPSQTLIEWGKYQLQEHLGFGG